MFPDSLSSLRLGGECVGSVLEYLPLTEHPGRPAACVSECFKLHVSGVVGGTIQEVGRVTLSRTYTWETGVKRRECILDVLELVMAHPSHWPIPALILVTHPCLQWGLDGKGHYKTKTTTENHQTVLERLEAPCRSLLVWEEGTRGRRREGPHSWAICEEDRDVKSPQRGTQGRLVWGAGSPQLRVPPSKV